MNKDQTENKTDQHQEERKQYFQKLKEWIKPLREDTKQNSRSAIFWIQVLGLIGLAAYVTIAACQWSSTLQIMRADQRAWINIQSSSVLLVVGKPIVYPLIVANTGKTPARKIDGVFIVEVLDAGDIPSFDYSNELLRSGWKANALFPIPPTLMEGLVAVRQIPGTKTTEPVALSQELLDKYNNGKIWFAIQGKVTYEDVFGVSHWMNICHGQVHGDANGFIQVPQLGIVRCAGYNDVDKN